MQKHLYLIHFLKILIKFINLNIELYNEEMTIYIFLI